MTSGLLTSNSDHTRSGLHEKHHLRFLDSCSSKAKFSKTAFFTVKIEGFYQYGKILAWKIFHFVTSLGVSKDAEFHAEFESCVK